MSPKAWRGRLAISSGVTIGQAAVMMKSFQAIFAAELERNHTVVIPGVGTFHRHYVAPIPSIMKPIFGKRIKMDPVPAKFTVRFKPFIEVGGDLDGGPAPGAPC
eukprot:7662935-Pyramimonas_sp.AAC.1